MKQTSKLIAALGVLSCLIVAKAGAATQFTNEFWISTNTNTANLGTLSDPYDGSTATKFDLVMTNMPASSTIHILAGTYQTQGYLSGRSGWQAKSGQKILGSGMDATIIHLTTNSPGGTEIIENGATATNIEVCDLTIDDSGSPGTHGVTLFGTRHAIRRVKAVNFNCSSGGQVFPMQINSGTSPTSEGNIIEECEVSGFTGSGSVVAILIYGGATNYISGIIRHNRVFLSPASVSGVLLESAYNCGYGYNVLIDGNYVNGAGFGLWTATLNTNLTVVHNTFKNCDYGMVLQNTVQKNIIFSHNTIALANETSIATYGCFFDSNTSFTNAVITGNTYQYDTSPGTVASYSISAANVSGLVMCNNSIDSRMTNAFTGCTG